MSYIADLHIHSKYSRATSKDMELAQLAYWAKIKGVDMLGTGDFTHPSWLAELEKNLKEKAYGTYCYDSIDFFLTTEVSNIYFKTGKTRKVHNILIVPSFKIAREVNAFLSDYGDLSADGRPVLGLDCARMASGLFNICSDIIIIPGHAWTPHFSIFGSRSGFDSPEECFEETLDRIYSIETGLSSDPAMNWRWSKLDRFFLTSHSDAHSPSKIGREANVFKDTIDYRAFLEILKTRDAERFLYTIEFFPEEGKYHWDGHRRCSTRLPPDDALRFNNICPACGKRLTIGVLHRILTLADRKDGFVLPARPGFRRVVPLAELISDAIGVGAASKAVEKEYRAIIKKLGKELDILLNIPDSEIDLHCPGKIGRAIINMRKGNIEIMPGYDGEYGTIKVAVEDCGGNNEKVLL